LESISNENPNLIIKFGGHAMAAGLSINEVDYNSFRASVSQQIDLIYPDYNYTGDIQTDGLLLPDQLSLNLANRIQEFGPWGTGFEEPKFHGKFHIHDQRVVGGHHLKMQVQPVDGKKIIDAIAFNQQNIITREAIGFIYKLDVNEFRGKITEQLVVDHILQY
jgi:single-stranded-DNA-specific exonuclease